MPERIELAAARVRNGPPLDDDADYMLPIQAGGFLPISVPDPPFPIPGSAMDCGSVLRPVISQNNQLSVYAS